MPENYKSEIDITVPEYAKSKDLSEKKLASPNIAKAHKQEQLAKQQQKEDEVAAKDLLKLLNPKTAYNFYKDKLSTPNSSSIEAKQEKINAELTNAEAIKKFFELNFGITKESYKQCSPEHAEDILTDIGNALEHNEYTFRPETEETKQAILEEFKKYISALLYRAASRDYAADGTLPKGANPSAYASKTIQEHINNLLPHYISPVEASMNAYAQKRKLDAQYGI